MKVRHICDLLQEGVCGPFWADRRLSCDDDGINLISQISGWSTALVTWTPAHLFILPDWLRLCLSPNGFSRWLLIVWELISVWSEPRESRIIITMQTLSSLPTHQLLFPWQTHLNGHNYLGPSELPGSPAGGHVWPVTDCIFACRYLLLRGLWW